MINIIGSMFIIFLMGFGVGWIIGYEKGQIRERKERNERQMGI